jgi:hypothetical protein
MAPPGLVRGRRGRRQVVLRDRVVGARGRHVARIKINMRRTRWKLRRMDVSASALRVADISPVPCSPSLFFVSFLFLFLRQGVFFLPPRFWVLHVQYHPSQTRHSRKARAQEKFLFFLPTPSLPSFLHVHDDPTQPNPKPPLVLTYPIASCFPQSAVVKHISL